MGIVKLAWHEMLHEFYEINGRKEMKNGRLSAVLLASTVIAGAAAAQDNMNKLSNMQKTDATFTFIEQRGERADALKAILPNINVPDGFEVSLYAVVPDARSMAVAPQGTVVFAGTRKDKVWSIVDRDRNRVADEVKDFAPSVTFDIPNGPCFSPDGFLFIAERNRVLNFPAAEFFFEGPDPAVAVVVPQGELVPAEEESFNHTARVCDVGPDGKLYISLGQPHNVQPIEKIDMYDEIGIGGIIRINTDGSDREVYTRGVRSSVGQDFHPETGDAVGAQVFADGWLDETTGEYRGRPMDIAFLKDGSMLVSDDFAGAIWRISYNPPAGKRSITRPLRTSAGMWPQGDSRLQQTIPRLVARLRICAGPATALMATRKFPLHRTSVASRRNTLKTNLWLSRPGRESTR